MLKTHELGDENFKHFCQKASKRDLCPKHT